MKGRQPGRPTKWVSAHVEQKIEVNKAGVSFAVWDKWKRKQKMLGTLTVSVGGVRWRPANGTSLTRHLQAGATTSALLLPAFRRFTTRHIAESIVRDKMSAR